MGGIEDLPRKERTSLGALSDFDLTRIISDFGCRFLVETGTGEGVGIEFAGKAPFEQVFSIEKSHALAIKVAFRNARNQKMTIILGRSERGLKEALAEIPAEAPVIFWMDTHPTFETDLLPSPLERELRLIARLRDISRDIFLVDDLRLYEDGAFEEGPCPTAEKAPAPYRNLDFVEDILGTTHQVNRLIQRTGYLCAFPINRA
jgi:hypothetical protein